MKSIFENLPKALLASVMVIGVSTQSSTASKSLETSLLKPSPSYRSNFNAQPNLDKGEVTLPVQASIIYIIKQSMPDFLNQIASHNDLQLILSDKVSGMLEKVSLPMEIQLIMPELSRSYGLQWHMHGNRLFVSNTLENSNRILQLGNMSFSSLKKKIGEAKLNPGANRMDYLEQKNAITLIGSAEYIKQVDAIIRAHQDTANGN